MDTLEMLHAIENQKVIYDIHYCRAGVGFLFYVGPADPSEDWRKYLTVQRYYPSFEEAVKSEFNRLHEEAQP